MLKIVHKRGDEELKEKPLTIKERIAIINSPEFIAKLRRDIRSDLNEKFHKLKQNKH